MENFLIPFKSQRVKFLKLKDDVVLLFSQKNRTDFGVYTSTFTFTFRSGRRIVVDYLTSDRLYFHEGMFPAYLGSKHEELEQTTFDEFVMLLRDFGEKSSFNTEIKVN